MKPKSPQPWSSETIITTFGEDALGLVVVVASAPRTEATSTVSRQMVAARNRLRKKGRVILKSSVSEALRRVRRVQRLDDVDRRLALVQRVEVQPLAVV